jgi:hypothetical protein
MTAIATAISLVLTTLRLAGLVFLLVITILHLVVALAFSLIITTLRVNLMATTPASGAKHKAPEVSIPQAQAAQPIIPSVEELVQDQTFYIKLCEEQSAVFRQNVEEFTRQYNLYTQSAEVAKPGQNWKPAPCDRDAFITEMKRRCLEVPKSIAE